MNPAQLSIGLLVASLLPAIAASAEPVHPLALDEVHYFVSDREAATRFFVERFGGQVMAHPDTNPLDFITFVNLRPGETSLNLSPKGPFTGLDIGDPKRWQRRVVPPTPDAAPVYGVRWVALRTPDLAAALARLEASGVTVVERALRLPAEPDAKAALVFGPDFNLLALVERPHATVNEAGFAFDHAQLLVASVEDNLRFFSEVYAASVAAQAPGTAVLESAGARLVVSEPEALGLDREAVLARDPGVFRYDIDHLSFLYADLTPAMEAARAHGHVFRLDPTQPLRYRGAPTVYRFTATFSPDRLQCEMLSEEGRTSARTRAAEAPR